MTSQFGALLRQLRLRAELTQEGLAERSELGVRTIRGLETGERADPRVGTVRRLADALVLDAAERIELFAAAGHAGPAPEVAPAPDARPVSVVDGLLSEAAGQLALAVRARVAAGRGATADSRPVPTTRAVGAGGRRADRLLGQHPPRAGG